jgi:CrcB protein
MQVEILKITEAHRYGLAVSYALVSIAAGMAAIWIATTVVRRTRVAI